MAPRPARAAPILHHCMPDRNSTNSPEAATSSAVPRSGCLKISQAGKAINTLVTSRSRQRGGSGRGCRYQATIIGMASFSSSEGWKRTTPMSSQRFAPWPSPSTLTATSSRTAKHIEPGRPRAQQAAAGCATPRPAMPRPRESASPGRRPCRRPVAGAVQHGQADQGEDQQSDCKRQVDARAREDPASDSHGACGEAGGEFVHGVVGAGALGEPATAMTGKGGRSDGGVSASHWLSILRAIGAAALPPQAPCSSTTAMAICGWFAGA